MILRYTISNTLKVNIFLYLLLQILVLQVLSYICSSWWDWKKEKPVFQGFCLYRINFSTSLYLRFMVTILTTFKTRCFWYFTCWPMTKAIDNISLSYSSHLGMQWYDIFIPRIIFYIYETAKWTLFNRSWKFM